MRIKSVASVNFPAAAVFIMLLLADVASANGPTPTPTPKKCELKTPDQIAHELNVAIEHLNKPGPPPFKCPKEWNRNNSPAFGAWRGGGGSHNLAPATAAVGLYSFPNEFVKNIKQLNKDANSDNLQITYIDWWLWFLASQVGLDPKAYVAAPYPPESPALKYFKGTEQFSNIYDWSVPINVVAVRYWAYLHQNRPDVISPGKAQQLIDLSKRYLLAQWAVYGLAASDYNPVWTYDLGERMEPNGTWVPTRTAVLPPNKPAKSKEYNPHAPRKGSGYVYNGSFIALAGSRSKLTGHWEQDDRAPLYDRATGLLNAAIPLNNHKMLLPTILNELQDRWNNVAHPADENLYGLTQNDIDMLKDLRRTGSSAAVSHVMQWLANIRTATPYHIMGWDNPLDGVWRASAMQSNTNGNGPNIYAVAYQKDDPDNPGRAKATFLYPWNDANSGGAAGLCTLEPGLIRAKHDEVRHRSGRLIHPQTEVRMRVPTADPKFHVVLSPDREPELKSGPLGNVTPSTAPILTPPETAFDGDVSWVYNSVPEGAQTAGHNETWDWFETLDPPPTSESKYVHQSALVNGDMHQHYFYGATETMTVNAGESLYAYVYLDHMNPPSEVMLQWSDPSGWEHRAYWGADRLPWGTSGTASRMYMGPLPPAGEWIRLEVPASFVGLEGRTLTGMAFTLFDGKAMWNEAGKNAYGMSNNLADGATTTQSSTWGELAASLAVDGNTNGNFFTHTNYDNQAWWQVDLGASYYIDKIKVWNRTDCCVERLNNFDVMISDEPFNGAPVQSVRVTDQAGWPSTINMNKRGRYVRVRLSGTNYLSLSEVEVFGADIPPQSTTPPPQPSVTINDVTLSEGNAGSANAVFPVSLSAASTSTVTVNYVTANGTAAAGSDYTPVSGTLTFSPGQTSKTISVPVIGDTTVEGNETFLVNLSGAANAVIADGQGLGTINNDDTTAPPPGNLAQGKPATQSSTDFNSPASSAVDGNTDGRWGGNSLTHTQNTYQPWWQVDLGNRYSINQVLIWNRTDCCAERLSNFNIQVSDAPFDGTAPVYTIPVAGAAGSPSVISIGQTGRYVRVQLTGTNYLSLAEVAVYGTLVPSGPSSSSDVVWVEDSLPAGAQPGSDPEPWYWAGAENNPPFSGTLAHQSSLMPGTHQHLFTGATGASALQVNAGDKLFAYVYLDPYNPPSEVMLQWNDGSWWNHRAYWGMEQTGYATPGYGGVYMGPVPPTGRWVRLEVAARDVGLEGVAVQGMAFTLFGGRATWDYAGKSRQDTVWVEDSVPYGATPVSDGDSWNWVGGLNPAPFSGAVAHQSNLVMGIHQHYFYNATGASAFQVNAGDKLFTYVYLDPLNPPQEVMLQWLDGNANWVRAYWGENRIDFGMPGLPKTYMGALPTRGRWIRLEVPAATLGLEGRSITGLAFTLDGGRATWDRAGKSN